MRLRIAHLYPREMNLYGDRGNVLVLVKRLAWRGHAVDVLRVDFGSRVDLRRADLIVGGGGPDAAQRQVATDLHARRDQLLEAHANGVPMLLVCGMFQLFGSAYVPADGRDLQGVGIFDAVTTASSPRITGRITIRTPVGVMYGYENHGGRTTLAGDQQPFGRVLSGVGNGGADRVEGATAGAAIGTYLHGPVLAVNPTLADHLLLTALRRLDPRVELSPLDEGAWPGVRH